MATDSKDREFGMDDRWDSHRGSVHEKFGRKVIEEVHYSYQYWSSPNNETNMPMFDRNTTNKLHELFKSCIPKEQVIVK